MLLLIPLAHSIGERTEPFRLGSSITEGAALGAESMRGRTPFVSRGLSAVGVRGLCLPALRDRLRTAAKLAVAACPRPYANLP